MEIYIYIVRFHPVVGRKINRFRPAVIVSSITNNIDKRFVSVIPVSTKNKNIPYETKLENYDFFNKTSYSINWYIRTIDTVRLEYKIGSLKPLDIKNIQKTLSKILQ